MSELLIHSMSEFWGLIEPCLTRARVKTIVEVGAEYGGMSGKLADYCAAAGGTLTSIDPEPKDEFLEWVHRHGAVAHLASPSLEALAGIAAAEAWVIDGDHNYYTVYNELLAINAACGREGKPLLAFLHDVSWPCARRDFYYAPERIPEDQRHPFSYDMGVTIEHGDPLLQGGLRGMGQFAIALHEGGPRNGVLTAVEDFIAQADSEERPLMFANIPAVLGLGIVFDGSAEWAEDIAAMLLPYHQNELLAKLELNRLANYLAVIAWQDREAERLAAAE